jgi:hypothetical protein
VSQETEYRVFDFSGGLNKKSSNSLLLDKEASDLLNITFGQRGTFKKRPGVTIEPNVPQLVSGKTPITSFAQLARKDGSYETLVFYSNGVIFGRNSDDGSTYTVTLKKSDGTAYGAASSKPFSYFSYQDTLYFMNSTDGCFKFTGKGNNNATKVDAIPKCDFCLINNDRAFYAGDPANKDYLYFSQAGNVESTSMTIVDKQYGGTTTVAGGGIIRFPTSTGIAITGISVFKGSLLIFKSNSVFQLSGKTPDDFAVNKLDIATGCVAPRTLVLGDNKVYYMAIDGIRYISSPQQDSITTTPLSDAVNPEMEVMVNKDKIHASFEAGKYYLFYDDPTDGKTLVFDETLNAWTKYDLIMTASYYNKEIAKTLMGNKDGRVFSFDETKLYDEFLQGIYTPITSFYSTPYYPLQAPEVTKRFRWLMPFFKPNAVQNSTIELKIEIDYKDSYKEMDAQYLTLTWGQNNWGQSHWGNMRQQVSQMIRFGGTGKTIRFTFTNDKIDEDLEVHGFVIGFKPKSRIR